MMRRQIQMLMYLVQRIHSNPRMQHHSWQLLYSPHTLPSLSPPALMPSSQQFTLYVRNAYELSLHSCRNTSNHPPTNQRTYENNNSRQQAAMARSAQYRSSGPGCLTFATAIIACRIAAR